MIIIHAPSADHDLRDGHSAHRQSFRFGESTYNALNSNSLSQFLFTFTMALSISIILCMIIAAAWANIRLERRYLCGHTILRPALLALDDREEAGLSKEPWVDPFRQGLTEIVVPRCSGRAAVMVDRLSFAFASLASSASYRAVSYVQNGGYKTPGGEFFQISSKQNEQTLRVCSEVYDRVMTTY